jgi:ribosome-binding factor A
MSRRTERINELLREEISALLQREFKDPRVAGVVSITEVDVSPDLRHAKVFVSVLGSEDERTATMAAMTGGAHFFERELRRRLTLRRMPELRFIRDESLERGARILSILEEQALPPEA